MYVSKTCSNIKERHIMTNPADIEQILRKYPQSHIYYHDNGAWIIYQTRPMAEDEWLNFHPNASSEDYMKYEEALQVMSGDDNSGGYVPELVEALSILLGMSTESA
jgi:hypothetical protein